MRIIRGKYGRRRFDVPRNITARPTTDFARENIFNGFIIPVRDRLGDDALRVVRGDAFRFIAAARTPYDIIFADPPYDHPRFDEIAELVMHSRLYVPGKSDPPPGIIQHRAYGSVNFSIFQAT